MEPAIKQAFQLNLNTKIVMKPKIINGTAKMQKTQDIPQKL